MSSSSQVAWFCHQLDSSDCAPVKRQYLQWHAEEHGIVYSKDDPLFITAIHESSSFAWSLPELLWRARLVSLDARTLWECLGTNMVSERVRRFIDPWNEQLAVKVAYYLLQLQPTSEEEEDGGSWKKLRAELDDYAAATIKPQGTPGVRDYLPRTTTAPHTDHQNADGTAATAEWSDKVAFIPMEAGNDFSEGSLRCVAPVPSCGVLLQVPRTDMFFRDTVLEHCALGRVIAAAPALRELLSNEEAVLVVCLVFERFVVGVEKSHWKALLTQCPPSYPSIPTTWTLGDLAELDGLDVLDDVLTKRTQLQTVADQLEGSLVAIFHTLLPAAAVGTTAAAAVPSQAELLAAFSWDHLAWAQSTFDSRAFNLNVDGAVVMALVPLADMINHTNRTDVLIRKVEPNGGSFTMQVGAALTAADVGRELWMSYGPLQNWELLQHYGFVLGCDNVHDKLPFPFSLPVLSELGEAEEAETEGVSEDCSGDHAASSVDWDTRRRNLLRRYALCLPGRCWIGYDGVPPPALLALLRVQLAQAEEFAVMERHLYGPFTPLSAQTEDAVVAAVMETVQCVLDVFPTSLGEDEEALAELRETTQASAAPDEGDEESVYNYTLCVQLRIGLKRIAKRALDWCRHRM
ncbi:hypothetical protein ABB37_02719 [Leptomonas pyrrhocoris]|uniref:Rubisco LSMT substrate-binding domain-containing protein n=1 Tax=Leptomonas pyrrhocoris TaxID=157538 RepID=A0A0N0VGF7_LEPPY|nr:hypothetical protein ABB37_02719 [Leptomonas pyrrhocoris]KPA82978.1 hypothetical protein ABB37_02719 [Leptomonas pyrrhocoris]|eukprot:XP_015661417.1 hypothetical protein ABB37_02719 [Leptomonas pyrrhocoris]